MSCLPLGQEGGKVLCGYAAIQLPEMAFHRTPDTLNMVTHAKVPCAVVVGFSRIPKPCHATVANCRIGDEMTASLNP